MTEKRRLSWDARFIIHALLMTGGIFFLLPLLWMMATSLKPLSEALKTPETLKELFVGYGYEATIDGQIHQVQLERPIVPSGDEKVYVLKPLEEFHAGEIFLTFGPDIWNTFSVFAKDELARMNTLLTPKMKVLTDENNTYDPKSGLLTLQSGNRIPAEIVRTIEPSETEDTLWLVRQWRPEDTDTKKVGAASGDVGRAWDVLPESELRLKVRLIPENYPAALHRVNFFRSLMNTLFICMMRVIGTVIASCIVAYGFAFLQFKGRDILFAITLATIMIPFPVTMVPVYLLFRDLGWIGTFKPLWVSAWFGTAFFIFLLRQFFLGLPKDLMDAARIDGCSEMEILWHMVVPLARPAIAMVALFTFIASWKDFMGPLIYLNHESQFTLSLALQSFASEHGGTPWHLLMAASTVFSLPLIILFFFAMKTFIQGISMSGMKG